MLPPRVEHPLTAQIGIFTGWATDRAGCTSGPQASYLHSSPPSSPHATGSHGGRTSEGDDLFSHDHDLAERCPQCSDWPLYWLDLAIRINQLKELTMTESADQTHLDTDVQAENAALSTIEAEIAALKAQPAASALDFTALDAAVTRMQADTPAAPALTPAPAPAAPVDPTNAPANPTSVPAPAPTPTDPTSGTVVSATPPAT